MGCRLGKEAMKRTQPKALKTAASGRKEKPGPHAMFSIVYFAMANSFFAPQDYSASGPTVWRVSLASQQRRNPPTQPTMSRNAVGNW
jgi:hypothetical protein